MRSRLLAAALLAVPMPALAEGGISLAVASSGIGAEPVAGMRLAPLLGVHGDAAMVALSHHFQSFAARDADHLKLRTAAAMIDLFPLAGGLRLSLGARYEVAPTLLGAASSFRSKVGSGWSSVGPVATVGWTRRLARGLLAAVEAGATLRADGPLASALARPGPVAAAGLGWRF